MRYMSAVAGFLLFTTTLPAAPRDVKSWTGTLVDGGCRDRSLENLRAPAADAPAVASNPPANPPKGISVAPQVMKAERSRATMPDTLDHASRYSSTSCALTAETKAFALLLPNGQLMELDEGGNTLAFDAFQSTAAGAAILNGKVGGWKPQAKVTGLQSGRRIKTHSVMFVQPPAK
jgi:hypothetical protein